MIHYVIPLVSHSGNIEANSISINNSCYIRMYTTVAIYLHSPSNEVRMLLEMIKTCAFYKALI